MSSARDAIQDMVKDLPPVVFRKDARLTQLTGKASRTLANLDSKGEGIPGRVRIGRFVAYPREGLLEYLLSQTSGKA